MTTPIALISSTIAPATQDHYGVRGGYDPATRLEQTRASIRSLLALGIDEIYLADNSRSGVTGALEPARVQTFAQHPYRNKGISEVYLLLAMLPHLPMGRPIIKLSGRYQLKRRLDAELGESDFAALEHRGASLAHCYISTIAYVVRDREIYERFLRETLRDIFGFSSRIVGPGSLVRIVRNSLFPARDAFPYDDPMVSIEHASWRAMRKCGYQLRALASLDVEGVTGQTGEYHTE